MQNQPPADKQTVEIVETIAEESEYSSHKEQLVDCRPTKERKKQLRRSLVRAYERALVYKSVPFINFGNLDTTDLARAFVAHPITIKATMACVNVAQRAIKRDLGIDFDTYGETVTQQQAALLAAYVKPLLPRTIGIPALMELDRYFWTDKEMRASKGNWEKIVKDAINTVSNKTFKKRRFPCDGEQFEVDAAYPVESSTIEIGIDVKRIESQRDIHKRADEIINKAAKFRKAFPAGRFYAVVYYPFPLHHMNAQSRLQSPDIEHVYFAGASSSSIASAVNLLVGHIGSRK